jgi:hypothetical protein
MNQKIPEKLKDHFGSIARRYLVCGLVKSQEADYAKGEVVATKINGPILKSHRLLVERLHF